MFYSTIEKLPKRKSDMNFLPNGTWKKIDRKLTSEEEKAAFLYTSKVNSAKIFAKYLD